ncbi:LOW QUALITY PROTEIN: membrane-spanning 4-domains subfamily A member 15 [Nycticebus coucang]|uniref:LOW QUALITY PROTEIN: membrane-spanning 4-domains subfamily A member 15 n=1 Tax=Nycticebus coucang TaxID=9470 RepID=UPI00234D8759|nr:LOW QUALITY PROTEIN: membrane-spanning 4-domains subfamily A member 15 [Nycticebus coucang]
MSEAPASNGVFVVIPPSNASGLHPPPAILPTSMCQPPGIVQFEEPPLGTQTPRAIQPPDLQPMETFLTGEPKALGTVQILVGLIHLGFGSVLLMVRRGRAGMLFIESGVPFWGGACFLISGSLSVAAEKNRTSFLVRSSLSINILSAMAAFAGTAILLMDFGVTNWDVGRGYLAVLTIFTILEFFIAVIATHFGCQATRAQANAPVMFLPNAFSTDFNIPSPAASPPPAYDNVAYAQGVVRVAGWDSRRLECSLSPPHLVASPAVPPTHSYLLWHLRGASPRVSVLHLSPAVSILKDSRLMSKVLRLPEPCHPSRDTPMCISLCSSGEQWRLKFMAYHGPQAVRNVSKLRSPEGS